MTMAHLFTTTTPSNTSSTGGDSTHPLNIQALEATFLSNTLLQLDHPLPITSRVRLVSLSRPGKELVRIVRHKVLVQHPKPLAVPGHLLPVPLHVLEIRREVREAPLEDLTIELATHRGLEVDVFRPSFGRVGQDEVGSFLDGAHERA